MRCSNVRATPLVTQMGRNDSGSLRLSEPLYSAVTLASRHACGVTE